MLRWAGTHISSDLRNLLGGRFGTWEHAVE